MQPNVAYNQNVHPLLAGAQGFSTQQSTNNPFPQAQEQPEFSVANTIPETNPESTDDGRHQNFAVGVAQDLVKTLAKVLSGPVLVDTLKGSWKDTSLTVNKVLSNTCFDALPSRLTADFAGALGVRLFNGETSFFGIKLPRIAPEVVCEVFTNLMVHLSRGMTSGNNTNADSASKNLSIEERELRDVIAGTRGAKLIQTMRSFFDKNLRKPMDKAFSWFIGVKAGKTVIDKEGNEVLGPDQKPYITNPEVDWKRYGLITLGSVIATMFLPKHTQTFGLEGVYAAKGAFNKLLRGIWSTALKTLSRINSTMWQNASGMHLEGHAFDSCFRMAVREKTLTPFVQNIGDLMGTYVSSVLPGNGATWSIFLKTIMEIPAVALSSGVLGISKKDRVPDHWKAVAFKIWDPVANFLEKSLMPVYRAIWSMTYKPALGMFEKGFDYGIKAKPISEQLDQRIKDKADKMSYPGAFARLFSYLPGLYAKDIPKLISDVKKSSEQANERDHYAKYAAKHVSDREHHIFPKGHGIVDADEKAKIKEAREKAVAFAKELLEQATALGSEDENVVFPKSEEAVAA